MAKTSLADRDCGDPDLGLDDIFSADLSTVDRASRTSGSEIHVADHNQD